MKTFIDAAGRTWTISLNLGTALAVKGTLDIDLLQPEAGDPPLLTRLGTDEMLLGEVICCLLSGQFETHKVTETDVRASFDGATLLAAQKAFYEELVGFFQSRGRADRARAVETQAAMIEKAIAAIEAKIGEIDVEKVVGELVSAPQTGLSRRSPEGTETDGAMSGSSPGPSGSIPDR